MACPTGVQLPCGIAARFSVLWALETRPMYHQSDAAIAGHLFCSFLTLLLRKELDECLAAAGLDLEWGDIVRDLDRIEQVTVDQAGKRFILRTQSQGAAGSIFKAVGVGL